MRSDHIRTQFHGSRLQKNHRSIEIPAYVTQFKSLNHSDMTPILKSLNVIHFGDVLCRRIAGATFKPCQLCLGFRSKVIGVAVLPGRFLE
jgi:hypothetical protein